MRCLSPDSQALHSTRSFCQSLATVLDGTHLTVLHKQKVNPLRFWHLVKCLKEKSNGNGHSATLSLSPPITAGNPWQGIALYQDPRQTTLVSDNWGPGATFRADGVVYLPYADLSMSGIAASNDYQCTKVATHTFATNGNVSLTFAQATAGCTTINMKQWNEAALHLTQ